MKLDDDAPKEQIRQSGLLAEPTKKQKSVKQENRAGKLGRGHRVPGSGNQIGRPGDARQHRVTSTSIEDILVECKRTDNIGLYLSDSVLEKHEREAAADGRTPVFSIEIGGRKKGRTRWYVIPEELYEELFEGE